MQNGYISLHRKIKKNWLWPTDREFTKLEAWIDLIMSASWKTWARKINGDIFIEDRGEYIASERFLAERWNWTRGKVRRFLDRLEKELQIKRKKIFPNGSRQPNKIKTRIIISNYEKYQTPANPQLASSDPPTGPRNTAQPCGLAAESDPPTGPNTIQQHIENGELDELASPHLVYVSKLFIVDREFHEALKRAYPTVDLMEMYPKIEVEALANPERFRGKETIKAWIKREAIRKEEEIQKAPRPSYYRYND